MQGIIFQLKIKKTSIKCRLEPKISDSFPFLIPYPSPKMLRHLYVVRIGYQEIDITFNPHF